MDKLDIITLSKLNITDFSEERNKLLKKSNKEWVLFLDSDETLSDELKSEIDNLDFKKDGYYIKRENYFCGQFVGEDNIIRLAKKGVGKWHREVHETWEIKGTVGQLKNPIIHSTAKTVSEMVSKLNYYSTLHANANKKEGKSSSLFKIVFFPILKLIQSLLMGRGFVFSLLQSFHSFLSWSKLYFFHS